MSAPTHPGSFPPLATVWRQRLYLISIIACFVVPLALSWWLVGDWRPGGSAQHGELLDPAQPLAELRFTSPEGQHWDAAAVRGFWTLIHTAAAAECSPSCQTALYDMRQVRLALGRDLERVKTLVLLDGPPTDELRQWLAAEHAEMMVGATDAATQDRLNAAFPVPGPVGEWIYLVDPLGNLLMRYPVTVDPSGILKDLKRLLRLSKIG
ncbi:MAG: hypothetical protein EA420_12635 [Candidatus Competibacteraceae bacterium]|nr:MAG: hypothetical protein EA420_12635 [Candidatus Competibacteraceae bacterium]